MFHDSHNTFLLSPRRYSSARSVAVAAVVLGACSGDVTVAADARVEVVCDQQPSAALGTCVLAGGGDIPCTGVPGEEQVFVPLMDGDPVALVLGPQGASMFVLGLETTGIFPGDPNNVASTENPTINMQLISGTNSISRYRGKHYFVADTVDPTKLRTLGIFAVVEGTSGTSAGDTVYATATIDDRDGQFRCTTGMFTVVTR